MPTTGNVQTTAFAALPGTVEVQGFLHGGLTIEFFSQGKIGGGASSGRGAQTEFFAHEKTAWCRYEHLEVGRLSRPVC